MNTVQSRIKPRVALTYLDVDYRKRWNYILGIVAMIDIRSCVFDRTRFTRWPWLIELLPPVVDFYTT